jgi:hypothetical protein
VSLGKHLVMADARLDTLMVLLRLYLHHSSHRLSRGWLPRRSPKYS